MKSNQMSEGRGTDEGHELQVCVNEKGEEGRWKVGLRGSS